jgi:hypothetical protein
MVAEPAREFNGAARTHIPDGDAPGLVAGEQLGSR